MSASVLQTSFMSQAVLVNFFNVQNYRIMEGRSRGLLSGGDRCSLGLTSLTLKLSCAGGRGIAGWGRGVGWGGMVDGVQRMLNQNRSSLNSGKASASGGRSYQRSEGSPCETIATEP